jgi:dihydrofolate reductase
MRMLRATTFLTLDGIMQAPGGPGEDDEGGFSHGGWSVGSFDDEVGEAMGTFMTPPFDLVLGRKTYDIFSSYWPTAPEEEGSKPLNDATKYVASRGRPRLDWEPSVLLDGDVPEAVRRLKQDDGPELQVHGSGDLLQTLIRHGLVDEFQLLIFPVLVGTGKRLFADGTLPAALELLESRVSPSGVVIGRYKPAGPLTTGSFGG